MNFLSHLFIDRNNDESHNIGLTVPDIIGFQNRKYRISITKIELMKNDPEFRIFCPFIDGLKKHITLDRWFHTHEVFKESTETISMDYYDYSGTHLGAFFSHILFEILIDRYILTLEPAIADDFYNGYKSFDFNSVIPLFEKYGDFNRAGFIEFVNLVANSDFLRQYSDFNNLRSILYRVAGRVETPASIIPDDKSFGNYCRSVYEKLADTISEIVISASFVNNKGI